MMKRNVLWALMAGAMMQLGVSCKQPIPADLSTVSLIPVPVELAATGSSFELNQSTVIYVQGGSEELRKAAELFCEQINTITGLKPAIETVTKTPAKGIFFKVEAHDEKLGNEGYELNITDTQVTLKANHPAGVFMGTQTMAQIIEKAGENNATWIMASGQIVDYPEYSYRGSMLDVSRHFFGVDVIKQYIDLMAAYKMNVLHLHLTDDQGWRIEIKSWPKLTTIGGSTEVGGGEGGYYTQEQYKDIVAYAKERFITIIPEIDMPGHTNAACVAYPELNGTDKKAELYTGTKVGFSTLATRKEVTYQFVDDVIREIAALTDGPYIHIGGDESHVTKEDDYVYFINRTRAIVKKYNKKMIGWDEIAHAAIDSEDIVQYWAKGDNARLGVQKGAKVLMSPATRTYLDMKYDSTTHIGLTWSGVIEVDKAYNWDPATLEEEIGRDNIIGIESPLWTETVAHMDSIEYLVFPRLIGHAEIGWSPAEKRNWDDYKLRLAKHGPRLRALGVDFYESKLVPWE